MLNNFIYNTNTNMVSSNNHLPSLMSLKQTAKANIKTQFSISKSISHVWIIAISDKKKRDFIVEWLSEIWMWAVVLWDDKDYNFPNISSTKKINPNSLVGFDFFVYDNDFEWVDVVKYMWAWIVPIMPEENTFSWILKDFDLMKFEWNWFFYKKDNKYCIFEKVITYLENIKFPEDKRVLLKNVTSAF